MELQFQIVYPCLNFNVEYILDVGNGMELSTIYTPLCHKCTKMDLGSAPLKLYHAYTRTH